MESISTSYDRVVWALAVWREARGENYRAKMAVAHTIRNRVADPRWPNSPADVVLQPRQFSSFNANDPNAVKWPGRADASWLDSCQAVVDVQAGVEDPTGGANHYHSLPISAAWPGWAQAIKQTVVIGAFRFYRL